MPDLAKLSKYQVLHYNRFISTIYHWLLRPISKLLIIFSNFSVVSLPAETTDTLQFHNIALLQLRKVKLPKLVFKQ
jgi:hypothetical protein